MDKINLLINEVIKSEPDLKMQKEKLLIILRTLYQVESEIKKVINKVKDEIEKIEVVSIDI